MSYTSLSSFRHGDRSVDEYVGLWPSPWPAASSQRALDDGISLAISNELVSLADLVNKARLLASLAPGSGSWLQSLPCNNLGLRLANNELRIALGLRLGSPLVLTHQCVCGAEVEANEHHGLACRRSSGLHLRHALANEVFVRAIRSIEVHAE
jgi:hypothetical protein